MQRQWGAIGWGIFTLVAGYLIDTNSEGKLLKDYSPCFYLLAVLYILDLVVAYKWEVSQAHFHFETQVALPFFFDFR